MIFIIIFSVAICGILFIFDSIITKIIWLLLLIGSVIFLSGPLKLVAAAGVIIILFFVEAFKKIKYSGTGL